MSARDADEAPERREPRNGRDEGEAMDAKEVARKDAKEYDEPERESVKSPGTGGEPERKTRFPDRDLTT